MEDDFCLDEFEQQQLELERRRIIVNQAVRRKTIDSWVSSRLSVFARPEDEEDVAYDDTEAPAPPLPPRNPGSHRISWPLGRDSDSPPSSPPPPLPTSPVPDSGPSAARLDLWTKRGANMSDQDDQQLVGFDDSPVLLPEPKKPPPSSAVAASQAELILNSLNAEKSQMVANGGPKGDTTSKTTNGHHHHEEEKPEAKPVNGHGPKVDAADHNGTEAGEPVYTEVPEDNIYEEVIPVQERKPDVAVSPPAQNAPAENGGTTVLYDDSSLSSEVSTELSPPPSNVGDCGSNGTTLSDPECDAAMAEASAPESHADIPSVVVQESTPVDSEQSNDEQADDSASDQADPEIKVVEAAVESDPKAECVAEPLVEPIVDLPVEQGSDSPPSEAGRPTAEPRGSVKPIVVAAALESAARIDATECEFTRVDDVQFVEPGEAARCTVLSAEATPEQEESTAEEFHDTREELSVGDADSCAAVVSPCLHEEEVLAAEHEARVEQPLSIGELLHREPADVSASPTRDPATTMTTPTPPLPHEPRHLKQSAEDSIIAREIRAQKEREEMIARERKLAQEAARLSSSTSAATEKTPCDRPPQTEATTSKPARLTTPLVSIPSAPSAPSANTSSPAPFPAPIEKRFTCPSDSKIADEIRELQEREEELRELRERLHVQTNEGVHKTNGVDESMVANGVASPTASSSSSGDLSRTVSIESLPPNGHHTPFGPRRKDKITVRPLSDGSEDCAPSPTFVSLGGESPIEREIRLARDREEALRKEKGLLGQLQAEGFVKKGELLVASSPSAPVSCKNGKAAAAATAAATSAGNGTRGSTQKILATSRIQQEIEEQTQREMALRDSGHIQTISQERTDSKVTRICSEAASAPTGGATSPSQLASGSRRVPPFESSLPNVEIFEKTPPAAASPARVTSPTTAPASGVASAVAKASNGHVSNGHAAAAAKGSSPAANGRGVSMQKFLASRGKELAFTSPPPQNGGAAGSNGFADKGFEYRELKPPQLQKGASDAVRKGLVTAETKIQEEMRAMKEREEELRRQRQRLLGQSQPNLSLQLEGSAVTSPEPEHVVDGPLLQRVNSNPSLPAAELAAAPALCSSPDSTASASSVPRRRSALIAQWEQRIQSTDVAKS